jgi:hypothetical protein
MASATLIRKKKKLKILFEIKKKYLLVVLALNSFLINVFVNVLDLLDYFLKHQVKMLYIVE